MNAWGKIMLQGCYTAAEMAAIGMGKEKDLFTSKMMYGNHLLAPTASDLVKYDVGTVFAGVHYDLNFLTIHGKSRYPGLFIWLRDGTKMSVRVPDGCLLLQSGIQFEKMTGGYIMAGFHEVVYTEQTKEAMLKAKEEGRIPWRISSTLFSHIRSDLSLKPMKELEEFHQENAYERYPDITSRDNTLEELKSVKLWGGDD